MYEDALARVDLFSGLRKKELKDLATYCLEGKYSPGSVLISQGEQGVGLFILTKGTVRITRATSPDGAEEVLGTAVARWRCWMICPALLRSRRSMMSACSRCHYGNSAGCCAGSSAATQMSGLTCWRFSVAACARPSNEPPSNWSSQEGRLWRAALARVSSRPARGASRRAGKSIRLPVWRECPREFPESSTFPNDAHPVYRSSHWRGWSAPLNG